MLASKSKASTSQGVGLVGVCHKSLGLRTFGTDGKKVLADVSPLALSLDVSPVSEGYSKIKLQLMLLLRHLGIHKRQNGDE